jgi:hypothetical protein
LLKYTKRGIYFYDAYYENFKLEELLKQYQRENRLKFDAIIFLIEAFKLTKGLIKALNDQENKNCLVFCIVNKLDLLKFHMDNEEDFNYQKQKIKRDIFEIFKTNNVNKYSYGEKNIYQTFLLASIFDNEDSNTNFFHFLNLK